MSKNYQYFSIPFDLLPKNQTTAYTAWFATWSTTPPVVEPGASPPFVIGVTDNELPPGAVVLGIGSKDPPPPPPPVAPGVSTSDYQASFAQWLDLSRAADE